MNCDYGIRVCNNQTLGDDIVPVKHGILALLVESPRHGYELKTGFETLTGGLWDLNIGQVYSTLERLRREGLVSLQERHGSGEDRKVYRVTAAGVNELEAWLEAPPLQARPFRDEIFVRLALLMDRDLPAALDLIDTQHRVYHLQMANLTRQKLAFARSQAPDRHRHELFLDAALLHAEADLKWLETCEEKIRAWADSNPRKSAPAPGRGPQGHRGPTGL